MPNIRSYHPAPEPHFQKQTLYFNCIPKMLFSNHDAFISTVREGAPGNWLACIVQSNGLEDGIADALGMTSTQLTEACQSEVLDRSTTEVVLDIARVLIVCEAVWGGHNQAKEWLVAPVTALAGNSPLSLLDTYEGRRWVSQTLQKIEQGEFS